MMIAIFQWVQSQKMKKMQLVLFGLVICIAIFFRFYQLQSVPPSPSLDEATIGWNAYSILLTGHDEYGYHLPILLRAYDDYRPALYVYFVIPFVKLLGLTVLSVRLPSAILSLITVIATYFFVTTVLLSYKYKKWVGLTAMFLLALSPFHVYVSRLGHEVNPGLTFAFLGALFFLMAVFSKKTWMFILSGVSWAAALYTYQSEKVFIPLLFVVLVGLFWKQVWEKRKMFAFGIVTMVVLSFPIIFTSFSPQSLVRLHGTSVFTNNPLYDLSAKQLLVDRQQHNILGEIIHNRRVVTGEIFLSNYFTHFNPLWWITNSGNDQFKIPSLGLLFWWELPLFFLGVIFLLKSTLPISLKILPIAWIMISFIAPGITTEAPHAMRSYNILPIPQFLEAFGLIQVFLFVKNISKNIYMPVMIGVIMISLVILGIKDLSYNYFFRFPVEDSYQFQFALGKTISYINNHKNNYKKIYISNRSNAYQSYMFYLFYTQYSPIVYAKKGGTISGGYDEIHTIDNVVFMPIKNAPMEPGNLYIANIGFSLPAGASIKTYFTGLSHIKRLFAFTTL